MSGVAAAASCAWALVLLPGAAAEAPPDPLSGMTLSPGAFRVLRSGTSAKAKGRGGGSIRFDLPAAAAVTFTIERVAAGEEAGGACRAPRAALRGPPCSRLLAVTTASPYTAQAGANTVLLTGRVGAGVLAPGRYVLVAALAPTGSASVPFRVLL